MCPDKGFAGFLIGPRLSTLLVKGNKSMTQTELIKVVHKLAEEVSSTKPCTAWRFTAKAWTAIGAARVYVNDRKGRMVAILIINPEDGSITGIWQPGYSLTRNELQKALGIQ